MRVFIYEHVTSHPEHVFPASLRAEGQAMVRAIVEDFDRVPDIKVLTLPTPDAGERAVREQARMADFTLVIAPEFDQLLFTLCRCVEEEDGCLLGPSAAGVALTADKLILARHLLANGVRTPPCVLVAESPLPFALPIVCKPRFGAGSLGISFSREAEQSAASALRCAWRLNDDMIAQPFVAGRAASVAFLLSPHQQLALAPAAQHLSEDGRFHYLGGAVPLPPDLAKRAVRVARPAVVAAHGLRGYVGVDVVLGDAADGSEDWVIEINPRLTTSYLGLRQLAETNLAEAMLRIVEGEEIAPVKWRSGVVEFRADGSIA